MNTRNLYLVKLDTSKVKGLKKLVCKSCYKVIFDLKTSVEEDIYLMVRRKVLLKSTETIKVLCQVCAERTGLPQTVLSEEEVIKSFSNYLEKKQGRRKNA